MSLDVALRHRLGAFDLDVAFQAPPGVTALFGPSGAGKTTVINAIAGLITPSEGRIVIGGRTVLDTDAGLALAPHQRRIGVVFQDARLFPHLTVRQNLKFGRWFSPGPRDDGELKAVVDLLGIGHLLDRRPGRLSGGEKQRVAIGRALLSNPRLLLMDEPLAALDAARKAEILPYLERVRASLQIPILYVSHAVEEVARLATGVVCLDVGRVRTICEPDVLLAQAAPSLLPGGEEPLKAKQVTQLSARVVDICKAQQRVTVGIGDARMTLPGDSCAVGANVQIEVPEDQVILVVGNAGKTSAGAALPVVVLAISDVQDGYVRITLDGGGQHVHARVPAVAITELELTPATRCTAILHGVQIVS